MRVLIVEDEALPRIPMCGIALRGQPEDAGLPGRARQRQRRQKEARKDQRAARQRQRQKVRAAGKAAAAGYGSADQVADARGRVRHAARGTDVPARHRERVRGAGARRQARPSGPQHHQPRHRPARLPDAREHRRRGAEGARRRPPRLHPGERHPAVTRGGRRGHPEVARRRGRSGADRDRAGRQGHDVLRDHDVRRARQRGHVPGPGLSDLPLGDRVRGRQAGADPALRGDRLLVLGRGGAEQDHAPDAADHRQQPGQPDGRRRAARGDRQARPPASPSTPRSW